LLQKTLFCLKTSNFKGEMMMMMLMLVVVVVVGWWWW